MRNPVFLVVTTVDVPALRVSVVHILRIGPTVIPAYTDVSLYYRLNKTPQAEWKKNLKPVGLSLGHEYAHEKKHIQNMFTKFHEIREIVAPEAI